MLELKNISFTAEGENGKKEILKNINLKIGDGFSVITGPNGSGKSTITKMVWTKESKASVSPSPALSLTDSPEKFTGLVCSIRFRNNGFCEFCMAFCQTASLIHPLVV